MTKLTLEQRKLSEAVEELAEKVKQFLSLATRQCENPRAIRLAVDIDSCDPLNWLMAQTETTKIFWRGRQNGHDPIEIAAVGIADEISIGSAPIDYSAITAHIANRLEPVDCQARYFGGIGFHTEKDHPDNQYRADFPAARFILPRFELIKRTEQTELVCNLIIGDSEPGLLLPNIIEEISSLVLPTDENTTANYEVPTVVGRSDTPDQEHWCKRVEQCGEIIKEGELEKIVLARQTTFNFSQPLNPWLLLDGFRKDDNDRFLFTFQPEPGVTFICASPELLYSRSGRVIRSEALAGTRPRSTDKERDRVLGEKLLNSNKERREHLFVENRVELALNQLCCQSLEKTERSLVKLQHVQHLVSRFIGHLKETVNDADLLQTLHPTPAVGGHPKEKAADLIYDLETFDRSWYAGPVGWLGADSAEFSVGIRSGILQKNRLTLFSGAGIVAGSIPSKEWDEIENKIESFMTLLSR